jgi:acyl carrier protein
MNKLIGEIIAMVALHLGLKKVAATDRLIEDLGVESSDLVNIIAEVEERYAISIDEMELPDIETATDLANLVHERAKR